MASTIYRERLRELRAARGGARAQSTATNISYFKHSHHHIHTHPFPSPPHPASICIPVPRDSLGLTSRTYRSVTAGIAMPPLPPAHPTDARHRIHSPSQHPHRSPSQAPVARPLASARHAASLAAPCTASLYIRYIAARPCSHWTTSLAAGPRSRHMALQQPQRSDGGATAE